MGEILFEDLGMVKSLHARQRKHTLLIKLNLAIPRRFSVTRLIEVTADIRKELGKFTGFRKARHYERVVNALGAASP
ncbi:hypothetical protein EST38_g3646 [Candolleomyces aberdarensis]|uniref:Uncharacterized protein n=1 Tax=Candolleomyces aberdarensis TaxID=2316362 RepID=A0A4V1Q4I7_9AGAR|nr:hypothetical protein EST38_g3646 [Candolleomyces aberdarensis]